MHPFSRRGVSSQQGSQLDTGESNGQQLGCMRGRQAGIAQRCLAASVPVAHRAPAAAGITRLGSAAECSCEWGLASPPQPPAHGPSSWESGQAAAWRLPAPPHPPPEAARQLPAGPPHGRGPAAAWQRWQGWRQPPLPALPAPAQRLWARLRPRWPCLVWWQLHAACGRCEWRCGACGACGRHPLLPHQRPVLRWTQPNGRAAVAGSMKWHAGRRGTCNRKVSRQWDVRACSWTSALQQEGLCSSSGSSDPAAAAVATAAQHSSRGYATQPVNNRPERNSLGTVLGQADLLGQPRAALEDGVQGERRHDGPVEPAAWWSTRRGKGRQRV